MDKENDFINFFNQFIQETKQQVTQLYIEGIINKEEYMRRMKNAKC